MIVFLSNYFNHHQSALSDAFYRLTAGDYRFIATEPMTEERLKMGWGGENSPYVLQYEDAPLECQELIDSAEVVIFGSAPYSMVKKRLKAKKLTFAYSERVYKKECPKWQIPLRAVKYFFKFGRYKSVYLLCASAYTAPDYARTRTFIGKAYRWGYFPEVKQYESIEALIRQKRPASLLWVARLIPLKHPELVIQLANRLKEEGYRFELNLIGNGEMEDQLLKMICDFNLQDCVHLLGSMKPAEVRAHMERSQIFMFTSDRNEGWGAVMNESMNSGCAVVASRVIGSVPFLVEHGKNGLIYEGDFESLYNAVKTLLDRPDLCMEYGTNAYYTMKDLWNAEVTAERLLTVVEDLKTKKASNTYQEGPCSRILND